MATIFQRGNRRRRWGQYIAQYFDHTGKRRTVSTRTTEKATAERVAAKQEADGALRREGVIDPNTDRYRSAEARPLIEHAIHWSYTAYSLPDPPWRHNPCPLVRSYGI